MDTTDGGSRRVKHKWLVAAAIAVFVAAVVVVVIVVTKGSKPFDPEQVPSVVIEQVGIQSNLSDNLVNCSYDQGVGGGVYQYTCTTYANSADYRENVYFQQITLDYDSNNGDAEDPSYVCTNPAMQDTSANEANAPACN